MKKIYIAVFSIVLLISNNVFSQTLLTDSFNFGEDRISHNYSESGSNFFIGSYSCLSGQDSSIRIGNSSAGDTIRLTVAVNVHADSIRLSFRQPWHGGNNAPQLWVENVLIGNVPYLGLGNCNFADAVLINQSANTADASINIMIINGASLFDEDGQICFLNVYSNDPTAGIGGIESIPIKFIQTENEIEFKNLISTSNVFIYDALGKMHSSKIISSGDNKINTEQLLPGIYFYRIENDQHVFAGKFMIK